MGTIGIREPRERASEILRQVREDGEMFEITYHGRVVARLVPVTQPKPTEDSVAGWNERLDALARAIGERWPAGVSAVDAVRDVRRACELTW